MSNFLTTLKFGKGNGEFPSVKVAFDGSLRSELIIWTH